MLSLLLIVKYLLKTKIVVLSIVAVALCSALLICISSLFIGFIGALEGAASGHLGDVLIQPYPTEKIVYSRSLISELKYLESVEAATPIVSTQGLLLIGKGQVRKVVVWGIDPKTQAEVTNLKSSLLKQGSSSNPPRFTQSSSQDDDFIEGYVGIGVLTKPDPRTDEYDMEAAKGFIGSRAVLMSGSADSGSGIDTDIRKIRRVNVPLNISDIAFSGVEQFDSESIYLPIEKLAEKIYPSYKDKGIIADTIQIKLASGAGENAIEQIRSCFRRFASNQMDWNESLISFTNIRHTSEITASMIAEYRKQMDILMVIFGIVSSGIIILVCCIFYMLVLTRQKDIAIMRSCGVSKTTAAGIFLRFGLTVGVVGGLVGLWVGRLFTIHINAIERWISTALGLNIWKSSVYMFSKIPNQVDWDTAFKIVIAAIAAALLGAIIPAIIAATVKPVKILRYE